MQTRQQTFFKSNQLLTILLVLVTLSIMALSATTAQADTPSVSTWQSTNLKGDRLCFDGTRPDTLIFTSLTQSSSGNNDVLQANWKTGQTSKLKQAFYFGCIDELNGIYFNSDNNSKPVRFTPTDPQGRVLDYFPHTVTQDGTQRYYDLNGGPIDSRRDYESQVNQNTYRLHITEDGGLTWQERGQQFNGKIGAIAVNPGDSRAIYAIVRDGPVAGTDLFQHSLYFSRDAGISWQKINEFKLPITKTIYLGTPSGRSTPVNQFLLYEMENKGGEGDYVDLKITNDGGHTFYLITSLGIGLRSIGEQVSIYHTGLGLLKHEEPYTGAKLSYSSDGGQSWKPISLPIGYLPDNLQIRQFPNLSSSLIAYYSDAKGWYSSDGGQTWQEFLDGSSTRIEYLAITPYSPTTLVGITEENEIKVLDLPQADKIQTRGVMAGGSGSVAFTTQTQHNYSYLFNKYWQDHGGLAQFGLPWTEAFREYNPADGKIYTVQYYERARFEYHPEFKGTQYEVLLGLLGNQLTADRRAKGEGAFNRFPDMHYPGATYFSETGHNLRNTFKDYWEANGGLAIYGYPTSEEFEEVNPDDGKTYIVQYFERNRFEYHPENKGTKYEVLLGLLGNTLLHQKGWL